MQTKLILQTLLDAPENEVYGLEVVRASGVGTGTCYAVLRRLEDEGFVDGRWEHLDPAEAGRPPRRYYRLNGEGRRVALLSTTSDRVALRLLAPGWAAA
jgi:DNA-binding PadR family transcriptional regulator